MKLLWGVISIHFNRQRVGCIFSGGCVEDPKEISIYLPNNMVSLYCERCGSFIRETPIHDITNPEILRVVEDLLEEDD